MFIKEPSNIQVCIKTCTAVSGSNVNILSITELRFFPARLCCRYSGRRFINTMTIEDDISIGGSISNMLFLITSK